MVAEALAVAASFSSSWPVAVTVFVRAKPALWTGTVVVLVIVVEVPGATVIEEVSSSPSWLSYSEVRVTGSVLAGLVLVTV